MPVLIFDALARNTNRYLFVVLDEGGHHYPNAWPGHEGATNVSQGVTMAALHLEFFLDNPRPV